MELMKRIFILSIVMFLVSGSVAGSPKDNFVPFTDINIDGVSLYAGVHQTDSSNLEATSSSSDSSGSQTTSDHSEATPSFFSPGRIAFWGFLMAGILAARRQNMS